MLSQWHAVAADSGERIYTTAATAEVFVTVVLLIKVDSTLSGIAT